MSLPRPSVLRPLALLVVALLVVVGVAGFGSSAAAQDSGFTLPENPANWINSPPLSNEALEGKAAFLWFFEETCPRCRERWPDMLATAKRFEGKPILFIAVNSGSSATSVASYVRQNHIDWPVIVDTDRALEQQANVGEISLQNIYQARVLLPDGTLTRGDWSNIDGTAERALRDAKWGVDPQGIPASLRGAWFGVEFKIYGAVAAQVKRAAGSRKPEEKAAGERLMAYVLEQMQKDADAAGQLLKQNQPWPAYKAYAEVAERYKGYDLPAEVTSALRSLEKDAGVKAEIVAQKIFDAAKKAYANPRTRGSAVGRLRSLVDQYPATEAGIEAKRVLLNIGG